MHDISTHPSPRLIAITMGCPVGIGPEIILRFLAKRKMPGHFLPVIVGDREVLQRCAAELDIKVHITSWRPGSKVDDETVKVIEPRSRDGYVLQAGNLRWGIPGKETGHAAAAYIMEAVRLISMGEVEGMVTCPISKYALQMAGYKFPGHTEMLASLCATRNYGMMMAGKRLKVSLVTIHAPLIKVVELIDQEEIKRIIKLTGETLVRDFGISKPRIAVAGLNPHGGETGLFGEEEKQIIAPAVSGSVSEQWDLAGPLRGQSPAP